MDSVAITTRDSAEAFLLSRIDYERSVIATYGTREFKLDRMRDLLARLGNPHDKLRIVHVAGTKGKGSTAAMIAAVLTAAGYHVGLFSSPHLERIEERLAIDGQPSSEAELFALTAEVAEPARAMDQEAPVGETGPTYFELTTAMAMQHFARRQVDFAVLEVGMGGRLDSTNVCQPAVSVITSISFDHTKQLGSTLAEIAAEKAGIVKPGVPVVSGVVDAEPRAVIERVCREQGCALAQLDVDFQFEYRPPRSLDAQAVCGELDFSFRDAANGRRMVGLPLRLIGKHQGANAAVALATLAELERQGAVIPEPAARRGLSEVRWPARVEVVLRHPTVVIDVAHNVASVAALLETLDESFSPLPRLLVFATTRDKDARGMLQLLLPRFERVILAQYSSNPRALPVDEVAPLAAELTDRPLEICGDAASAWAAVRRLAGPDELVCVTGSFFLAAEIMAEIRRQPLERSAEVPEVQCTQA